MKPISLVNYITPINLFIKITTCQILIPTILDSTITLLIFWQKMLVLTHLTDTFWIMIIYY